MCAIKIPRGRRVMKERGQSHWPILPRQESLLLSAGGQFLSPTLSTADRCSMACPAGCGVLRGVRSTGAQPVTVGGIHGIDRTRSSAGEYRPSPLLFLLSGLARRPGPGTLTRVTHHLRHLDRRPRTQRPGHRRRYSTCHRPPGISVRACVHLCLPGHPPAQASSVRQQKPKPRTPY